MAGNTQSKCSRQTRSHCQVTCTWSFNIEEKKKMVWWPQATLLIDLLSWKLMMMSKQSRVSPKVGGGARVRSQLATKDDTYIYFGQTTHKIREYPCIPFILKTTKRTPGFIAKNKVSWGTYPWPPSSLLLCCYSNQNSSTTMLPVPEGYWIYPFHDLPTIARTEGSAVCRILCTHASHFAQQIQSTTCHWDFILCVRVHSSSIPGIYICMYV